MTKPARYRRKLTEVQAQFTGDNTSDVWAAFGADGGHVRFSLWFGVPGVVAVLCGTVALGWAAKRDG